MKRLLSLSDDDLKNVFSQPPMHSSADATAGSFRVDQIPNLNQDQKQNQKQNQNLVKFHNICNYPPCSSKTFESFDAYTLHVSTFHTYVCSQCQKCFFNDRLLDIHIEENHSSFFAQRRERGDKIYLCFEPLCIKKFTTRAKRRRHLIDKHQYPESYRFDIIDTGTNNLSSLLRRTK